LYADGPTVEVIGTPEGDLEENKDTVRLECKADANPPATILWRKAGRPEIYSFQVSKRNCFNFILALKDVTN